ncbi:hypothetical protein BDR05DRAFT_1005917 [Suillus weaverae]|nr:hypothetical protein BDR05DRAFT_1005917 [Suillus weaverae]
MAPPWFSSMVLLPSPSWFLPGPPPWFSSLALHGSSLALLLPGSPPWPSQVPPWPSLDPPWPFLAPSWPPSSLAFFLGPSWQLT